jgi:hypothetical protein
MRGVFFLVLLGSATLLYGCGRGAPPAAPAPAPAPAALPVPEDAIVYSDNSGGIRDSLRLVIRDAGALTQIWQQATAQQSSPPPLPSVDFNREMVLVAAAGRMTPEDQIHIDSVQVRRAPDASGRNEQVMTALVRTVEGCRRFRADAYPIQIVRVRRFDGPVVFVERRERMTQC